MLMPEADTPMWWSALLSAVRDSIGSEAALDWSILNVPVRLIVTPHLPPRLRVVQ